MKNRHDIRQILTWGIVILAIVGLFVGLAYLGGSSGTQANILAVPVDSTTDRIQGPSTAKATIVEYSDFQCPACAQYEPIVREVLNVFPNDVQLVYRHFPLTELHPHAMAAATASEAAQKQGKFWEYHHLLFDQQAQWSRATSTETLFTEFAVTLGLNKEQFQKDLQQADTSSKIKNDIASGNSSGINATPTFYLNGTKIQPQSLEEFKTAVQKAIDGTK